MQKRLVLFGAALTALLVSACNLVSPGSSPAGAPNAPPPAKPPSTKITLTIPVDHILRKDFTAAEQQFRLLHANATADSSPVMSDDRLLAARSSGMQNRGADLSRNDYSHTSRDALAALSFNTATEWPDSTLLPLGFNPGRIMDQGRDPGLSIRNLNNLGVTGKGVAIAVIDLKMSPAHQEFTGRIIYTEIYPNDPNTKLDDHGAAAASILAGSTIGVAPECTLYYFAVPDPVNNWEVNTKALEQILGLNAMLPPEKRIRVVSVSAGFTDYDSAPAQRWLEAAARARDDGVAVVDGSIGFPIPFYISGARPWLDRNDPDSYEIGLSHQRLFPGESNGALMVPADYRTTAGGSAPDAYTFWGEGRRSWATPWLAGLITLGFQVNPDISVADLYQALEETATVNKQGIRVPNPTAFIERVRR